MIVSFAWTTDAFLAGRKTCTRRIWSERYFAQWVKAYRELRLVHQAYDKTPRAGGEQIGLIRLTCEPYRQALADMPESDLEAEGGLWASKEEFIRLFAIGGGPDYWPVVVRFDPLTMEGLLIPRREI